MNEAEKAKVHADLVDEPIQAVPIEESKDVPISTISFRYGFLRYSRKTLTAIF
jgi:hypothetical protein